MESTKVKQLKISRKTDDWKTLPDRIKCGPAAEGTLFTTKVYYYFLNRIGLYGHYIEAEHSIKESQDGKNYVSGCVCVCEKQMRAESVSEIGLFVCEYGCLFRELFSCKYIL